MLWQWLNYNFVIIKYKSQIYTATDLSITDSSYPHIKQMSKLTWCHFKWHVTQAIYFSVTLKEYFSSLKINTLLLLTEVLNYIIICVALYTPYGLWILKYLHDWLLSLMYKSKNHKDNLKRTNIHNLSISNHSFDVQNMYASIK